MIPRYGAASDVERRIRLAEVWSQHRKPIGHRRRLRAVPIPVCVEDIETVIELRDDSSERALEPLCLLSDHRVGESICDLRGPSGSFRPGNDCQDVALALWLGLNVVQ